MNDGRVHARFIHLLQEIILREAGDLAMGRIGGQTLSPDMDLGIYNQHDMLLLLTWAADMGYWHGATGTGYWHGYKTLSHATHA
jgi:hypothetical protein